MDPSCHKEASRKAWGERFVGSLDDAAEAQREGRGKTGVGGKFIQGFPAQPELGVAQTVGGSARDERGVRVAEREVGGEAVGDAVFDRDGGGVLVKGSGKGGLGGSQPRVGKGLKRVGNIRAPGVGLGQPGGLRSREFGSGQESQGEGAQRNPPGCCR